MGITVGAKAHFRNGAASNEAWAGTNWWVVDGVYYSVSQSCRVTVTTDAYGATAIGVGGLTAGGTGNKPLLLNVTADPAAYVSGFGQPGVAVNANGTASLAVNLLPNTTYYVWLYTWAGDWSHRCGTESLTVTSAGVYGTAGTAQAADGFFGSAVPITVTGGSAGASYTVTVSCAGRTETLQTQSANTNLTWTPDLATYAALLPNAGSAEATVSCQTYYAGTLLHTTATTVTLRFAPGSLPPALSPGWASAAFYNSGTAAENIAAFVQGYSRAEVSFDSAKIACQYGASVAGYEIACNGAAVTAAPYRTEVLPGTGAEIVCTVTDSRGQRASETLTVSLHPYAEPGFAAVSVFRCDSGGGADEDGTYISVTATAAYSSLGGLNACTLEAYSRTVSAADYDDRGAMVSGTAKLLAGCSPDLSYDVKIVLTDALGNTAEYAERLPTRVWAMKFRPDGNGVGFGKAPERGAAIETPAGWTLRFGEKQLGPDMLGATEEGATAAGNHTAGTYFLWGGKLVEATAAISTGDALAGLVTETSVAEELTAIMAQLDELAQPLETGTLTKVLGSGTADNITCVKKGCVVTVAGRIHSFSQSGVSITFFNVPDGFRPPAALTCLAGCYVGGIGAAVIPATINANGNVVSGYSSSTSYPMQEFSFFCSYHI